LKSVVKPYDSSASPTLTFTYYDSQTQYEVDATQKIDGSQAVTTKKLYNGLGELVRTQGVGCRCRAAPAVTA